MTRLEKKYRVLCDLIGIEVEQARMNEVTVKQLIVILNVRELNNLN